MLPEILQPYADTPALKTALDQAVLTWQRDIRTLADSGFFLPEPRGADQAGCDLSAALINWQKEETFPSLCAMIWSAFDRWDLARSPDRKAALVAALLGEEANTLAYHNNTHFRKVTLQAIRLIEVHNEIFRDTPRSLSAHHIALILIAACIHDYKHDGLGNTLKAVHTPGRLENLALDQAWPYLQKAGLTKDDESQLRVMLLGTDVSPLGEPSSYMNQIKVAYKKHYLGKEDSLSRLNVSAALSALEKDAGLSERAMLLQDADIATSAGIDYTISQIETHLFVSEIGASPARPVHLIKFLEEVCGRKFLTDAGQKLYGANMARIYALAEKDFKAGNAPFDVQKAADFKTKAS